MTTTVLKEIGAFLLGRRYWANVVRQRWPDRDRGIRDGLSEFIFTSREDAEEHRRTLEYNSSWKWIATVSFRSRKDFTSWSPRPLTDKAEEGK